MNKPEDDTGFTGVGQQPITDTGNLNSIGQGGIYDPNGNLILGPGGGNTNQQPQVQPPMTADWQYGLWDFVDAPTTFCQAWCCPSYVYARNLNNFEGGDSGATVFCRSNWWKHFCMTWFCCNASCLIRSPLRTKIRRKSNIKQSYRDTIGSCCWPCGLTQETREIEFQQQPGGRPYG